MLVHVKDGPAQAEWKEYQTRTLDDIPGFSTGTGNIKVDRYGGRSDITAPAKGFFYPIRRNNRWWLVSPEGGLFLHKAVAGVYLGNTDTGVSTTREQFPSDADWAAFSARLLSQYGFNGVGGWSDADLLQNTQFPPVYTLSWNFMAEFARSKGLSWRASGHAGYPEQVWPVFHPEFAAFCDSYGQRLAVTKGNPFCIGHFSDNELQTPSDLLDRTLGLDMSKYPEMRYNVEEADRWLLCRKGRPVGPGGINDEDRVEYIGHMYERYFQLTTTAIRKYDPNHLCLGSRFHGFAKTVPAVLRVAGQYLDVVSINYYKAWSPQKWLMDMWVEESGKPFMITEWYAKGHDSGLPNSSGAGWLVKTQKDRGLFYHNFTIGLIEHGGCVGWHWFKYMDNNPQDLSTDPSNRDSNKGIVTYQYKPYIELLDAMKRLNDNVYALADHFDVPNR